MANVRNVIILPPLFGNIHSKPLKLFGCGKKSNKVLTKLCLEGLVSRKRSKGEPKYRWTDNAILWSPSNELQSLNKLFQDPKKWLKKSHLRLLSAAGGDNH